MSHHKPVNISTWKEYCEGKLSNKELENIDFTFLLNRSSDEKDFEDVFSYFSQAQDLTNRCLNLSYSRRKLSKTVLSDEEILRITIKHIKELRKICITANNEHILQWLDTSTLKIVDVSKSEYDKFYEDDIFRQFIDSINDYIIFNHIKQFPSYLDIERALYHYAGNDFRLTWYLSGPFFKQTNVFDGYYDLWLNFADYFVSKDGIKVVRTNNFVTDKK